MLNSGDQGDVENQCQQLGESLYLRKPVNRSELWEVLTTALNRLKLEKLQKLQATDADRPNDVHDLPHPLEITPQRRLRILLAEDNVVNQRLVVRLLEKHGHTIIVANTGREVLDTLAQQPVDLVLMDVQMPDIDGFEATALIRAQERQCGGHLTIIALTAHAMKGDQERCLASGMDAYISKPIDVETLSSTISTILNDSNPHNLLVKLEAIR
jgi:CheY-like chemotaxis protein